MRASFQSELSIFMLGPKGLHQNITTNSWGTILINQVIQQRCNGMQKNDMSEKEMTRLKVRRKQMAPASTMSEMFSTLYPVHDFHGSSPLATRPKQFHQLQKAAIRPLQAGSMHES